MKRSRVFKAEDLPEHIRRLNAGVLGDVPAAPIVRQGAEMKTRQSERKRVLRVEKLNKTEARFLQELGRSMMGMSSAIPELDKLFVMCYDVQPPRYFQFEDGDTYTPDFLLLVEGRGQVVVEVKGGYRGAGWEQGWERFKRAAEVFGRERGREFWLCEWRPRESRWRVTTFGGVLKNQKKSRKKSPTALAKLQSVAILEALTRKGASPNGNQKKQGVTTMTTTKFSDADAEYWALKKQAEERFLKKAHEFQDEMKKLADNEFDALCEKYRRYHPNKAYWRAVTWEYSRRLDEKAAVELAAMAERMKAAPVGKTVILREELRRMWAEEYAHEAGAADCRAGEDYKTFGQFCKEWSANFDIR